MGCGCRHAPPGVTVGVAPAPWAVETDYRALGAEYRSLKDAPDVAAFLSKNLHLSREFEKMGREMEARLQLAMHYKQRAKDTQVAGSMVTLGALAIPNAVSAFGQTLPEGFTPRLAATACSRARRKPASSRC